MREAFAALLDLAAATLMTFESAYRHLDRVDDRFGLVVVDEVHHFGTGFRAEALESSLAPHRLGLSATPPAAGSAGAQRLAALVGPVVCEVAVEELMGTHLAPLELIRLSVRLDAEERARYQAGIDPFLALARSFRRIHPGGEWQALIGHLGRTSEGRSALVGYQRARTIASYPHAKRALVRHLLERHAEQKTLLFTALAAHAYSASLDNLIPAITGEIGRIERNHILAGF